MMTAAVSPPYFAPCPPNGGLRCSLRKGDWRPVTRLNDDPGGRRELYVKIEPDHYPEAIETASLQVRWYKTDDYTFHYREVWESDEWQCRWDRHPHPHNAAREHFHEPPTAADDPITDPIGRVEPHYLFARTMANVSERVEQLWENESS